MSTLSLVTIDPDLLPFKHIVLRQSCTDVAISDPAIQEVCKKLVLEMFDVMYAADGAAVAAPQVGVTLRLVVMDPAGIEFGPHVLVNPEITWQSDEEEEAEEGCLSLPCHSGSVRRAIRINVRAYDMQGQIQEYQVTGWLARVFQHEIDHLNGILYPDRLAQNKQLLNKGTSSRRRAEKALKKTSAQRDK